MNHHNAHAAGNMRWRKPVAVVATMLLAGAASGGSTTHGNKLRADGTRLHWSLNHPAAAGSSGLLLVAQGSGCQPALSSAAVQAAHAVAPGFTLLTVEKYGVSPNDRPADAMSDCSSGYRHKHTVSQRVSDAREVLQSLCGAPWWNGQLVLFGGSEGGAVVAQLTPLVLPDAVVVYSSGLGEPLSDSLKRVVPPQVAQQVDTMLAQARQDPTGERSWGGNSFRWWADVADRVPVRALLTTSAPVLLVQGGRDASAPVASARLARDAYQAAGKGGLTYWEYPDHDHFMVDTHGTSHRTKVMARSADWVAAQLRERPAQEATAARQGFCNAPLSAPTGSIDPTSATGIGRRAASLPAVESARRLPVARGAGRSASAPASAIH